MYLNTAHAPTLSGQQVGAFDSINASALTVYGSATVTGTLTASAFAGNCVSSSLTYSNSNVAASTWALSNVAANAFLKAGGTVTGSLSASNLTASGNITCTGGKYYGDGSALSGVSGGGGGGNATTAVSGINIVNTINTNSSLVITATNTSTVTGAVFSMSAPNQTGIQVVDPGSPFDGVGSNASMTSAIMAGPNGDLLLLGANNIILWPLTGVDEAFGSYGTQITDPYLFGYTRIRIQKAGGGGAIDAMIVTSAGSGVNQYPVITATNSRLTVKYLYYTTTFAQTSDATLKTNVIPLPSALPLIEQLNPVSFNWTSNALHTAEADQAITNYGFLAQEVQAVIPGLVENMEDGLLGVKALSILPYLVKAVQELSEQVKALQSA